MHILTVLFFIFGFLWPISAHGFSLTLNPGQPLTADIVRTIAESEYARNNPNSEPMVELGNDHARRKALKIISPHLPLANKARSPMTIQPVRFNQEAGQDRFTLEIVASLPTGQQSKISFTGKVDEEILYPTLHRQVLRGQLITADNLIYEWQSPHASRRPLTDLADIVGKQANRTLRAGSVIFAKDLQAHQMVARGDEVTVIYRKGPLLLTTIGRALDHGKQDDRILISNLDTRQQFKAVVTGPKEVTVSPTKDGTQ